MRCNWSENAAQLVPREKHNCNNRIFSFLRPRTKNIQQEDVHRSLSCTCSLRSGHYIPAYWGALVSLRLFHDRTEFLGWRLVEPHTPPHELTTVV